MVGVDVGCGWRMWMDGGRGRRGWMAGVDSGCGQWVWVVGVDARASLHSPPPLTGTGSVLPSGSEAGGTQQSANTVTKSPMQSQKQG